jgi:hypothetical protein
LEDLAQWSFLCDQIQANVSICGFRLLDPSGVPQFTHGGAAPFSIGSDLKKSQTGEEILARKPPARPASMCAFRPGSGSLLRFASFVAVRHELFVNPNHLPNRSNGWIVSAARGDESRDFPLFHSSMEETAIHSGKFKPLL